MIDQQMSAIGPDAAAEVSPISFTEREMRVVLCFSFPNIRHLIFFFLVEPGLAEVFIPGPVGEKGVRGSRKSVCGVY